MIKKPLLWHLPYAPAEHKVSAIVKEVNALKTELEATVKKAVSYTHLTLPTKRIV